MSQVRRNHVARWAPLIMLITGCADPTAPARLRPPPEAAPKRSLAPAPGLGFGFGFLPPLAPATAAPATFDAHAAPTVDVCVVGPDGACGAVVARFTFGAGERDVRLDQENQEYAANWKTKLCVAGPCTLGTDPTYRIRVWAAAHGEIGSIDVRLVDGNSKAAGARAGLPTIQNGSTVPIKFWIADVTPNWELRAPSPVTGGLRISAVYAGGDNAVFAAYGFPNHASPFSVWRFDLATDAWSQIATTGIPDGLPTRRIIHDPVRHELLTFVDGPGPVWSVAETGGTWRQLAPIPSSASYYEPAVFWHPVSQRLTFFGGYGLGTWHDELWSYDRAGGGWAQAAQSIIRPMPRFADEVGIDEAGGALFIAGGHGYPTGRQSDGALAPNDLWRLDFATNAWTQVLPNDPTREPTYIGGAIDAVPEANALYRFGGIAPLAPNLNGSVWEIHPDLTSARNALERLDLTAPSSGWRSVATAGTPPSPRWSGALFYDPPRHRLLVVGGQTTAGALLDVFSIALP